ncbi:hypothetical protein GWK47_013061 [Chionoecetes opilio]|uniref:Uncharacterized protein n=1 Tax=Chionoecetes opilio TaxID=41210 RepID=A0A8J5CKU8_CHIOP|nr:hypothetical protein GWK47_013061 [Chionoecetes opilio]
MRWGWLTGSLVVLLGFQALVARTAPSEEGMDALSIEKSVLDILTPLLGDVTNALQGFIDIGKIGMGVVKFINIISDQTVDNLKPKSKIHHWRSRRHAFEYFNIFNVSLEDMNFGLAIPLADRKMLAMFEVLSDRLDQMENGVNGIANSLRYLTNGMQNMVRWEITLNTMEEYMRPINTLYRRFRLYQAMKDKIEDHTLMDFANAVVSHDAHSVMSLMAHLHSMAAPEASHRTASLEDKLSISALNDPRFFYQVNERVTRKMELQEKLMTENMDQSNQHEQLSLRPSLFRMLQHTLETSDNCHLYQSPQQLMEGLHVILALTEARGFAMLEFAWMILRYSEDMLSEAKSVLKKSSREFTRCDPRHHLEGETYIQLTELLQGYIENEVDMNEGGSCSQTCGYYQHAMSESCYMPSSQYCGKHRRCKGIIHDCRFYHEYATVCASKKPYRRYDSITYENRKHLGSRQDCQGTEMKVDSWWRFFSYCAYCLCLCDDPSSPSSDRYISLVPALSDLQNNMVVTGVKFTKQRQVIHVQIQQGQVLPQGQINSSTIQWVNTTPIQLDSAAYTEGTDYKKLSFEDRSIDFDRLEGPKEHVVTGVRFRMLGSHLNLEVKITPVNYTSGVMQLDKSYWISNDNTPAMAQNPRREIELHSPDDPTKFPALSNIDSQPDTFMRFVPTDRVKDVAQLTVPFFDSQTVAPTPSSWLSGIELLHKGQPGSGGFLGMKVMTYDMTLHMQVSSNEPRTIVLPKLE